MKDRTVADEVEKRPILNKHIAAIHCKNTFSLLQRKMANALLYNAYDDLLKKEIHTIAIGKLCKLINYSGHNYDVIKEAARLLASTTVEWNIFEEELGEESWTISAVIASCSIKGSMVEYSYSAHLRTLLYNPKYYGKINLIIQSKFTSSYGLALYENCIRYQGLPSTGWILISEFRKIMGVPEGRYGVFRDFKRRVLDKAVVEVNTNSNIIVEPILHRSGNKVIKLRFNIKLRARKNKFVIPHLVTDDVSPKNIKIELILKDEFGISDAIIEDLLASHTLDSIVYAIHYVHNTTRYKNTPDKKTLSGYVINAIREGYKDKTHLLKNMTAEADSSDSVAENDYVNYLSNFIIGNFYRLTSNQQEKILMQYKKYLASQGVARHVLLMELEKYGIKSDVSKEIFGEYLLKNHPELQQEAMSKKNFMSDAVLEEKEAQNSATTVKMTDALF